MHPIRRFRTTSLRVRLLVLVLLSLVSFVVARALIGVEVRDDGVPVVRGEVVDGSVDVYVIPAFPDDAELRLYFDDATREDGFARLRDGGIEITTLYGGTMPLVDYLRGQGVVGYEVPIESSCEIMAPDHALFGALCAAYARSRMPVTHPDIENLPCSTCHVTADLEASYERARNLVPTSATPPAGHRDVGATPCATCHAGFAAGGDAGAATPPPGHREIGAQPCSNCHGSTGDGGSGGGALTPPPGHREIGSQPCSNCHDTSAGDPGTVPVTLPPGHRDIGSQACSTCHWPPGDPGIGSVQPPREHRAIGDLKCVACHGSGGDWDDDDEHEDDDDD